MPTEVEQDLEEQQLQTRKRHKGFITRIYIISTIFLVIASAHWFALTEIKTIRILIVNNSQLGMFLGFLAYLGFLYMIHFTQFLLKRSYIKWIFTLIMAELGSINAAMAVNEGQLEHVGLTFLVIAVIISICVILSNKIQNELYRDIKYLTLWTIRFYLLALVGVVISTSVDDEYVEALLMMFTGSFMTMFLFTFARSLGSFEFFEENEAKELFLALMFYYNMTCVWSAAALIFEAATAEAEHEEEDA